jgi:hypothetical protein
MNTNPHNKDEFTGNSPGGFRITPNMVQAHAGELAQLKGRYACDVTESDLAQARKELAHEPETKT